MRKRKITKLICEGQYIVEVEIELLNDDQGWSPYISLQDAQRLDEIMEALQEGDLKQVNKLAKVYSLTPVTL